MNLLANAPKFPNEITSGDGNGQARVPQNNKIIKSALRPVQVSAIAKLISAPNDFPFFFSSKVQI